MPERIWQGAEELAPKAGKALSYHQDRQDRRQAARFDDHCALEDAGRTIYKQAVGIDYGSSIWTLSAM